jgi:hypothetical protein
MVRSAVFVAVLFTVLASCQTQKVAVNVYTPAAVLLPPEMKSILVTSRYVPATGPYEDVQWGAYETVDSLKWNLAESIVDTLARRLADGEKYLVKARHFPRMLRHNEPTLPDPLPWEGLNSYAKKEYVQSLLIIEGFDIQRTPIVNKAAVDGYEASFSVGVTTAIRIYEPEKMRIVDDSVYRFQMDFSASGKSGEEATGLLPDEVKSSFIACSKAAESYTKLITPGESRVERFYFTDKDSSMTLATQALKEGKWGRAESKWKWLAYNSPDSTVQARASFNMAIACERDGRINQALGFARRSQRIKPTKESESYIRLLEQKMEMLEQQVREQKIIKKW